MFLARWAHRLLLWVGVAVVFAVALYAGFQGGWEWLLPGAQAYLESVAKPLIDRLPHFETVDRVARVLGATGTAATAAFGVWSGLYYAKRNLPQRLRELLASTNMRLLQDRAPLLAAISEPSNRAPALKSVFYVSALNRALGEIGFSKLAAADESLQQALHEIDEQIATSNAQMKSMQEQKIAAHILRGSVASARAESNAEVGADKDRELAERELTHALDIRPDDLDALELRGRQRDLRGNAAGALEDFDKLIAAASARRLPVRAARGYRCQADVLEQEGTPTALSKARRHLQAGIDTISAIGSLNQEALFEKARVHDAYGRLQIKRHRLPSAKQHLSDAISCYKNVPTEASRQCEKDATETLRVITGSPVTEIKADVSIWSRFLDWSRGMFR